jgi:sec-independent protein translocase protein TatC
MPNYGNKFFIDHLDDLKKLLIRSVIITGLCSGFVFFSGDFFVKILTFPLEGRELHFLSPTDSLNFYFKIYTFFALCIASPFLIAMFWAYVKPVLKPKEVLFIRNNFFGGVVLSGLGILYGYFKVLPVALNFLLGLEPAGTTIVLTASNYIDFVISSILILVLVFQTPLVVYFLVNSGIIPKKTIQSKRELIYLAIVILMAVITPTGDIFSLCLVVLPMIGLFEAALLFAKGEL